MKHGFLFWFSLLFVSVVMASFAISSSCFAVSSPSQAIVDEINLNIEKVANYYGIDHYPIYTTSTIQMSNSDLYCIFITDSTSPWQPNNIGAFFPSSNPLTTTSNTSSKIKNIRTQLYSTTSNTVTGIGDWTLTKNAIFKYMYTQFDWASSTGFNYSADNEYGADIILKTFDNLVFDNSLENTAYNGNLFTYYYQGDFYSNNQIKLGDIIPNDSYYFEIRLRDSVSLNIKGTSFVALNTNPFTFYNDGAIYINNNYEVFAIPRLLSYSKQYQLEIESYYGDGGNDDLQEDIDWFIFLPNNAVVSGDVITSLGSGDFTQQDNTNTMIGFLNNNAAPSGDLQAILGTSGNILSGDLFKDIKMPEVDGMNRTTLFDLLYAIAGTIGESGDAYFDFQMHGETPTRVYASQFTTPNGPLKTFISSFLVFFTFYFLLLQIRHAIEMLSTANIKGTLEYVDASLDNMFYM